MSNVIGFLEKMGQDANLRFGDARELELALSQTEIDAVLQAALMRGDQAQLEALLGVSTNVCCLVAPGKDGDDEGDERPAPDDDEISGGATTDYRVSLSG